MSQSVATAEKLHKVFYGITDKKKDIEKHFVPSNSGTLSDNGFVNISP